jgi:hypothetical protein
MNVLVLFLIGAALIGGGRSTAWVRERSWLLIPYCVAAAACFYSLRVVL